MIAEAAQAATEVVKQHAASTETLIGLGILIVSNVGLWLEKFVQISKNRTSREEAEAREAEAKVAAAAKPAANGNGIHEKYILPHSLKLQELEGKVQTIDKKFEKFEGENRDDHGKMFDKLDDIKDLVIGKSAGAA